MQPSITLRPVEVERDFRQIAALFAVEQDEPESEPALRQDYEEHRPRIFRLMVAENELGELMGFNWATRSRFDSSQAYFYVIVKPEERGKGAGSRLYADLERAANREKIRVLNVSIRDTCPECLEFAKKCGFVKQAHYLGLALDLDAFDNASHAALIDRLEAEGFRFTTMEALGNTDEMQRKLYRLNDSTAMETLVPAGSHSWLNFADFKKKVCQADWYLPAGQWVAIDTASGEWAAMSAITRYAGANFATNLHTGVAQRYHGRGLARAMLALALGCARKTLQVSRVRTDEEEQNTPALELYRALGYTRIPGIITLEKNIP